MGVRVRAVSTPVDFGSILTSRLLYPTKEIPLRTSGVCFMGFYANYETKTSPWEPLEPARKIRVNPKLWILRRRLSRVSSRFSPCSFMFLPFSGESCPPTPRDFRPTTPKRCLRRKNGSRGMVSGISTMGIRSLKKHRAFSSEWDFITFIYWKIIGRTMGNIYILGFSMGFHEMYWDFPWDWMELQGIIMILAGMLTRGLTEIKWLAG